MICSGVCAIGSACASSKSSVRIRNVNGSAGACPEGERSSAAAAGTVGTVTVWPSFGSVGVAAPPLLAVELVQREQAPVLRVGCLDLEQVPDRLVVGELRVDRDERIQAGALVARGREVDERSRAEPREQTRDEHRRRDHRERDRSRAPDRGAEASRPRTRPYRPPLAHPTHAVREHDRERGGEQHDRIEGTGPVLEHRVREPHERDRRQDGQERASGADRERVRRERRGPHRRHRREHQGRERGRGRHAHARLLPDELERAPHGPERLDRREAVPGRLRQDDPGDREREADQARDRREQQPPAFEQGRDGHRCERRGHELERGLPAGEHAAERERRRQGQSRDGREP